MYNTKDSIVALATTPGKSALNVIRFSGPNVKSLLQKITFKSFAPKPNFCSLQKIFFPDTKVVLDQGVVVFFKKPKSYTGQNLVELSVHGGSVVAKKIIKVLIGLGARQALPGEFSYRAFVNGKIDLIQAEAVASIIETNSDLGAFYSAKNLIGGLSNSLLKIRSSVFELITYMEYELDFVENEIEHKSLKQYVIKIKAIQNAVSSLLDSSFVGNEKDKDVRVCIAGKTNVGKSSLFNRLCGYEKAIVTNVAGTTRDVIEGSFSFEDMSVGLVDTAGIRGGGGKIEKIGIKKTFESIAQSDILLFVDNKNPEAVLASLNLNLNDKDVFLIQNKIDKYKKQKGCSIYHLSCLKNKGIDTLSTDLFTSIKRKRAVFLDKKRFVVSPRVNFVLKKTLKALSDSIKKTKDTKELVVVISSLYVALDFLSEASAPISKDEVINKIFGGFCVGK